MLSLILETHTHKTFSGKRTLHISTYFINLYFPVSSWVNRNYIIYYLQSLYSLLCYPRIGQIQLSRVLSEFCKHLVLIIDNTCNLYDRYTATEIYFRLFKSQYSALHASVNRFDLITSALRNGFSIFKASLKISASMNCTNPAWPVCSIQVFKVATAFCLRVV